MSRGTRIAIRRARPGGMDMTRTDLMRRPNGIRVNPWAIAIGCTLLACATAHSPATDSSPPTLVSPDDQPSNVQHPDARAVKRGVIVPSDVQMPGSAQPVPAMTETASPGAPLTSGADK
jgi:hypothetical protein